jgi:hypothetical protein
MSVDNLDQKGERDIFVTSAKRHILTQHPDFNGM